MRARTIAGLAIAGASAWDLSRRYTGWGLAGLAVAAYLLLGSGREGGARALTPPSHP